MASVRYVDPWRAGYSCRMRHTRESQFLSWRICGGPHCWSAGRNVSGQGQKGSAQLGGVVASSGREVAELGAIDVSIVADCGGRELARLETGHAPFMTPRASA